MGQGTDAAKGKDALQVLEIPPEVVVWWVNAVSQVHPKFGDAWLQDDVDVRVTLLPVRVEELG